MTRDRILAAARSLVEAGGVDALSMRKLAAELGVAPTAIYWHVGGRDDVLGELADQLLAEITEVPVVGRTPVERIASIARSVRREVRASPHLFELLTRQGRGPALSFNVQLSVAREVTAAGLTGKQAAAAVRAVLYVLGGFVVLEQTMSPNGTKQSADLWRGSRDPDVEPGLRRHMAQPTEVGDAFEVALVGVLRGLLPS